MRIRAVFLPVIAAGVLVAFGIYVAIACAAAGQAFWPALDDPRPGLLAAGPLPHAERPRLARRVVVVVIDGLRLRDSFGLPYLDALRRRGVDASARSHYPTLSIPNHTAIVTGVPPAASGVRTNAYRTSVLLDSLMDRARAAHMASAYVGDLSRELPVLFTRAVMVGGGAGEPAARGFDFEFENDFDAPHYPRWPGGFVNAARRLIDERHTLIVLVPGAVDDAGHAAGADDLAYRAAARRVDAQLEKALARLDLDHDAVIVTADHGHTDAGGHGGIEPEVVEVPLILAGAGVRPGAAIADAELIDIAPTAAALLGIDPPHHALGRTLDRALILPPELRASIRARDGERIHRNRGIVDAWRRAGKRQVISRRAHRAPIAMLALALGVLVIVAARRVHAIHVDWRVLVIALPAFPLTYYALLGVFGQQYSPSAIPARGSAVAELFELGALATGVQIVASWFALRGRVVLAHRLAAANAIAMCGLVAALVPAGVAWAAFPGPFADVPGPTATVLVPAVYIACACYALAATASMGLEIVVFFARAVDPRITPRLPRRERDRTSGGERNGPGGGDPTGKERPG